jgi:hypothetical protein
LQQRWLEEEGREVACVQRLAVERHRLPGASDKPFGKSFGTPIGTPIGILTHSAHSAHTAHTTCHCTHCCTHCCTRRTCRTISASAAACGCLFRLLLLLMPAPSGVIANSSSQLCRYRAGVLIRALPLVIGEEQRRCRQYRELAMWVVRLHHGFEAELLDS